MEFSEDPNMTQVQRTVFTPAEQLQELLARIPEPGIASGVVGRPVGPPVKMPPAPAPAHVASRPIPSHPHLLAFPVLPPPEEPAIPVLPAPADADPQQVAFPALPAHRDAVDAPSWEELCAPRPPPEPVVPKAEANAEIL